MKIQWTNKCSGEQGYVKEIKRKDGHFVNTFDKSEARVYSSKGTAQAINVLDNLCPDNTYAAVGD